MDILRSRDDLRQIAEQKICLAIGVFDGIHLGHQQVIRQTLADAKRQEAAACVITFDRHPNATVAPDHTPPLIYSLPQKLRTIESLGIDQIWLIEFDKAFSQITGQAFVENLIHDLTSIQSICVGRNFTFGHKRSGSVALLETLGKEHDFIVHGLAAVALDESPVSSTRVRQAITTGDFDFASQMLGRPYSLEGTVVKGDKLGNQIGFPTANIDTTGLILPPNGVYAIHVNHLDKTYRAVLNIGLRPTLGNPDPQLRVEAHLLDFSGDLYGENLEITFVKRLRSEMKFNSLDELKAQIARDIDEAQIAFSGLKKRH